MRVKGRFVKRATEQQAKAASSKKVVGSSEQGLYVSPDSSEINEGGIKDDDDFNVDDDDFNVDDDEEMPDVNDPDAGFCPTTDQPYRRLRRHTIT
jgi:hypothetical protein